MATQNMRRLKFAKFSLTKTYTSKSIESLVEEKREIKKRERIEQQRRARKDMESQQLLKHKVENMNDTLQYFTGNYRPLIRQGDQEPQNMHEMFRNAVSKPFVFGARSGLELG
jgi:hypothetical protein